MIDVPAFGERLGDTLRFERLLPGPIERLWDYLTRPGLLGTWFDPLPLPTTPGTAFEHVWRHDQGHRLEGRMRVYLPPDLLEYEWTEPDSPSGEIRDSIVRFELTDGRDVRLVLTHRLLPATSFVTLGAGWHAHLDALGATLRGAEALDVDARYAEVEPHYRIAFA